MAAWQIAAAPAAYEPVEVDSAEVAVGEEDKLKRQAPGPVFLKVTQVI